MTRSLLLFIFILLIPEDVYTQNKKYPEHFGDVFNSDKFLLGKNIFKGDVGLASSKISFVNSQEELIEFYRVASKVNFHINPFDNFYIKNTFYIDLIKDDDAPFWLSNHFYQIGVYNWRNRTLSYGYENYQPNRFRNAEFDYWTNIKRGLFFVSYNLSFSNDDDRKHLLFLDETSKFTITPMIRVQPEYVDQNNRTFGYVKPIIVSNFRYVILKNIYIETALFYYPIRKTKLLWDPDFTYGFGIFDWRAFKINFTYGNWMANRFPWLDKEMKHGFMNGEFTLFINYSW
jgi:hypothetical protein